MFKRVVILNGIAIIAVVISHAAGWGQIAIFQWADRYQGMFGSGLNQDGGLFYYLFLIVRQLVTFCVPAFLITSGFFVAYAIRGPRYTSASWKFVKARVLALLIPYAIWSAFIFVSDYYINGMRFTPLQYIAIFLSTGATGPYYFVPLLMYFYLLSPFLAPLAKSQPRALLWGVGIFQVIDLTSQYATAVFHMNAPLFEVINRFTPSWAVPHWLIFFTLGLVIGYRLEPIKHWIEGHRPLLFTLTAVLAVLAVVEPEIIYRSTGVEWRAVPLTFSTYLYGIAFTLSILTLSLEKLRFTPQLFWLGSRSYGIYLLHMKSMEFIARLVYHFAAFLLAVQFLYQPILLFFGLGIPTLVILFVMKTPLRKVYPYLFG